MTPRPPDPKPGDPILADHWNYLIEQVESLEIEVVPPLYKPDENTIALAQGEWMWIKLTGSPTGTAHPWTEQIPLTTGTWEDGSRSGTTTDDPARETNGSTANLTGKIVRAKRSETSYEVLFTFGAC